MKRIVAIIFILVCIIAGTIVGGKFFAAKETPPKALVPSKMASSDKNENLAVTRHIISTPTRLSIPTLNIDASIESVGMDEEGRMDVPKNDDDVAWYSLGFKPGDQGSAVIAGHFDRATGGPAVFYDLAKLKPGDTVIVSDTRGKSLTFTVTGKKLYPYDDFPLQEVFNSTDKPRLNFITCDGVWNSSAQNYSQRLVVYTELSSQNS